MDQDKKKQLNFRNSDHYVAKNWIQKKWKRFPIASHYRTQSVNHEDETKDQPLFNRTINFLKVKWILWAWHYIKSRLGGKWKFQDYKNYGTENGIYDLCDLFNEEKKDNDIKISLIGDWGSAIKEAYDVAQAVHKDSPHYTIHLGDIYYVGTKKEVKNNMLGHMVKWPIGSCGSFALNANHEMYARGKGYFKYLLPTLGLRKGIDQECLGQKASFFCLKNDFWIIIGIDTGYNSIGLPILEMIFKPNAELPQKLIIWLKEEVKIQEDDKRGVIILSHHQYYSRFEKPYNKPAEQISNLLHRPVLWFWGHEHRFAIYGKNNTKKGKLYAYGRCIGHGGLPIEDINDNPKTGKMDDVELVFYDQRNRPEPIGGTDVGYNGYANLIFNQNTLTVEYKDVEQLLVQEKWEVGNGGILIGKSIELFVDEKDMLPTGSDLQNAIK